MQIELTLHDLANIVEAIGNDIKGSSSRAEIAELKELEKKLLAAAWEPTPKKEGQ